MRKILASKAGFSYILTCVLVLFVVMIIAVSIQYSLVFHLADADRAEKQLTMDSLVTKYSVEKYNSLKQGDAWENSIDRTNLVNRAYSELGFGSSGTSSVVTTKGEVSYSMSRPSISATTGDSVGVTVRYTLSVPFRMFGKNVATIQIPVEIVSSLIEK